jgi:hypothetical protein
VVYPLLLTWNSNSGAADGKARFALDYSIGILAIAKFPATTGCVVSREYNGRDKVSYFPPAQARTGPGASRTASVPRVKVTGPASLFILSSDKEPFSRWSSSPKKPFR